MKAKGVRMYGAKDIRLEEFELPEIKKDEVLLKVMSDSICMSTWKEVKLGSGHIRVPDDIADHPVIIGHEFSGVIEKVGSKWADEYKAGERFVVLPGIPDQMGAPGYSYEHFGGAVTYCIVPNDVIEKGCLLHYDGDAFYEVSVSSLCTASSAVIWPTTIQNLRPMNILSEQKRAEISQFLEDADRWGWALSAMRSLWKINLKWL